jgi:hypothetical protein
VQIARGGPLHETKLGELIFVMVENLVPRPYLYLYLYLYSNLNPNPNINLNLNPIPILYPYVTRTLTFILTLKTPDFFKSTSSSNKGVRVWVRFWDRVRVRSCT